MKIPLDRGLKEAAKENMIMEHIITYHMIAFVCGFALDLLLGDPHALPNPIRLIGIVRSHQKTVPIISHIYYYFQYHENFYQKG